MALDVQRSFLTHNNTRHHHNTNKTNTQQPSSTGDMSRNRTVGLRIGRGEKLADIVASMGGAHAEGVLTARSAHELAKRHGLDCATIEGIYRVLHEGADPVATVKENMSRELKHEVPAALQQSIAAAAAGAAGVAAAAAPPGGPAAAAADGSGA